MRTTPGLPPIAALARALEAATPRPRLLIGPDDLDALRGRVKTDPLYARLIRRYLQPSEIPTSEDVRERLKRQARRLTALGFVALVGDTEREIATDAARGVLRDLATAETWNPRPVIRSFLDRAETAIAVALCYDWLYDRLESGERALIEGALWRNILAPAAVAFADPQADWPRRRENYTLVSNAGIALAALAVGHIDTRAAAAILGEALNSTANALEAFAPDGAWAEGPSYWTLSVRSAALILAALESVFGSCFGLADQPGFAATGQFSLHVQGPSGKAFNFGDSISALDTSALRWLAHRNRNPADVWQTRHCPDWFLPFAMIWTAAAGDAPAALDLPTGKIFRGCALACFRSSWSASAKAAPVFFALKGGVTREGNLKGDGKLPLHAHADIGTFVVESGGCRWALDLGGDRYDLPGYFQTDPCPEVNRWRYYRTSSNGHNTLTVAGRDASPEAETPILSSGVDPGQQWAVLDLSAAYGVAPGQIRRGGALIGRSVIVQDEIAPPMAAGAQWRMHTSAELALTSANTLRLRQNGEELVVSILTPKAARLTITTPPPPETFAVADDRHGEADEPTGDQIAELPRRDDAAQSRASGAPLHRIEIAWPAGTRRLTVMMQPPDAPERIHRTRSLSAWVDSGPLRGGNVPRKPLRRPLSRLDEARFPGAENRP